MQFKLAGLKRLVSQVSLESKKFGPSKVLLRTNFLAKLDQFRRTKFYLGISFSKTQLEILQIKKEIGMVAVGAFATARFFFLEPFDLN